jgi:hypothetical protein
MTAVMKELKVIRPDMDPMKVEIEYIDVYGDGPLSIGLTQIDRLVVVDKE